MERVNAPLNPCPFCGNERWVMLTKRLGGRWVVHCGKCGNTTGQWLDKQDAVRAWNRRIGDE